MDLVATGLQWTAALALAAAVSITLAGVIHLNVAVHGQNAALAQRLATNRRLMNPAMVLVVIGSSALLASVALHLLA